jgi:hypothetical protein
LQQDALMPLLQMIEYIPAIQRTDALVKALQKKIEDADGRLQVTVAHPSSLLGTSRRTPQQGVYHLARS